VEYRLEVKMGGKKGDRLVVQRVGLMAYLMALLTAILKVAREVFELVHCSVDMTAGKMDRPMAAKMAELWAVWWVAQMAVQ
jgi:hypothetical protein